MEAYKFNDLQAPEGVSDQNGRHPHPDDIIQKHRLKKLGCEVTVGREEDGTGAATDIYTDGFHLIVCYGGVFHITAPGEVLGWMSKEQLEDIVH